VVASANRKAIGEIWCTRILLSIGRSPCELKPCIRENS
jgi:hypothetical protein